jgi:hypothetical protein
MFDLLFSWFKTKIFIGLTKGFKESWFYALLTNENKDGMFVEEIDS